MKEWWIYFPGSSTFLSCPFTISEVFGSNGLIQRSLIRPGLIGLWTQFDHHVQDCSFQVGDTVWLSIPIVGKLESRWQRGGRSNPSRDPTPIGDWWWQSITDCTHQRITMLSPNPTQNTTRQCQHPESWGYVLDTPFCWAWRGDAWRISATTTVSNQASPTSWQITVLGQDRLHLDGTDITQTCSTVVLCFSVFIMCFQLCLNVVAHTQQNL